MFEPRTWRRVVAHAVRTLLPKTVIDCLLTVAAEEMYSDTLSYLHNAFEKTGNHLSDDMRNRICDGIMARFGFLRSFHACRPDPIDTYLRDGILPLSRPLLARLAYERFEGTIPFSDLESLAANADLQTREGLIYFSAELETFIERCRHYLIYGAESICCLWQQKDVGMEKRFYESHRRGRERGIPTVFICNVPIGWLSDSTRREAAGTILTNYFRERTQNGPVFNHRESWGYSIDRALPPQFIQQHIHPAVIRDPLNYPSKYINPHTRCLYCTNLTTSDSALAL